MPPYMFSNIVVFPQYMYSLKIKTKSNIWEMGVMAFVSELMMAHMKFTIYSGVKHYSNLHIILNILYLI